MKLRARLVIVLIALIVCVLGSVSTLRAAMITISNPSFETFDSGNFNSNGNALIAAAIPGWTPDHSGESFGIDNATQPFADNGLIPEGTHVAFIQSVGATPYSLAQTLPGLDEGMQYQLTFAYNARTYQGDVSMTVTLGDHNLLTIADITPVEAQYSHTVPYSTASVTFTADAGDVAGPLLTFANTATSDQSLLIDNVALNSVPEPSTAGLLLLSGGILLARKRAQSIS